MSGGSHIHLLTKRKQELASLMGPSTSRHFLYLSRGFVPKLDQCNVEVVPPDRTHGMQAFEKGFEPLKGRLCIREGLKV